MGLIEIASDGTLLTSSALRKRGLHAAYLAQMGIRVGAGSAEKNGRSALRDLVEAFLLDRRRQVDLFTIAHRLGRQLMESFGCPYQYSADEQIYRRDCPVRALHAVAGLSIAWTWEARCSICDAEPFACDHVPGETYGGDVCVYDDVNLLGVNHVALTPDPDFICTWNESQQFTADELLDASVIDTAGQTTYCTHCAECSGQPTADDLDPVSRWRRLTAEQSEAGE